MSIEYVRAVLEMKKNLGKTERLLLIAIAEHADDQGYSWPGNELLAKETEISERHVQRLIPELAEAGLLTIVRPGKWKGHPGLLRLLFPPAKLTKRATIVSPKDDTVCRPSDHQPDPQRTTNDEQRATNFSPKDDTLPEKTGDNPMNPNNNPTAGGVDLDLVSAAPSAELVEPTPTPPARGLSLSKPKAPKLYPLTRPPVKLASPHLRDPRKFVNGYIPPDTGSNPVEVWYEHFSIHDQRWRLTAPQEDDLVRSCPDINRLRPVLKEYLRHGHYGPRNMSLVNDWYRDGIPNRGGKAPQRTYERNSNYPSRSANQTPVPPGSNRRATAHSPTRAATELTARLINGEIDEAEYERQCALLLNLPNLQGSQTRAAA